MHAGPLELVEECVFLSLLQHHSGKTDTREIPKAKSRSAARKIKEKEESRPSLSTLTAARMENHAGGHTASSPIEIDADGPPAPKPGTSPCSYCAGPGLMIVVADTEPSGPAVDEPIDRALYKNASRDPLVRLFTLPP